MAVDNSFKHEDIERFVSKGNEAVENLRKDADDSLNYDGNKWKLDFENAELRLKGVAPKNFDLSAFRDLFEPF
jgi:hypothetical protein